MKFLSTIAAASLSMTGLVACTAMDSGSSGPATASSTVGGAAMYASRNIVENAVNSPDHTTLVAAVKAAGLVETLSSPGPFTVFAPTNDAFARLPSGAVDSLLQPANLGSLRSVLTYHVVPGRITAAQLVGMIGSGGGSARIKTVEGSILTARLMDGGVTLVDEKGGMARVTQADVIQANGVIHVTDAVSIPG